MTIEGVDLIDPELIEVVGVLLFALVFDLILGEPPSRLHPVVWMGSVIGFLEDFSGSVALGVPIVLVPVVVFSVASYGLIFLVAMSSSLIGVYSSFLVVVVGGLLFKSTFSVSMLVGSARRVSSLSEKNLDEAREELKALAGRDASSLSPEEVRSAVVESLAENYVDGFLTPVFYFTVFLPLGVEYGVAGAMGYKAVNTADSMVGYTEKGTTGYASARLDDLLNYVPSRISTLVFGVSSVSPGSVLAPFRENNEVGSPNSGWPMSSIAHVLGVRLEKPRHYSLGSGDLPGTEDVERGVRIVYLSTVLTTLISGGVGLWLS